MFNLPHGVRFGVKLRYTTANACYTSDLQLPSATESNLVMKYIQAGRGERTISQMTLGTVQLGMNYGVANKNGKPSLFEAFRILDAAAEGGINSIDTARAYGDSEEVIGKYLSSPTCKLQDAFITTKFAIDPSAGTSSREIEKQILDHAASSLTKLNIKKIHVYMLHQAKDMHQYGKAVPDTLNKLKKDGLIEKAGVSVYFYEEAEEMLEYGRYEAIQIPVNIFDDRIIKSRVIEKLQKAGNIVFARSVFLQGLFFLDPDDLPQSLQAAREPLIELRKLSHDNEISTTSLALSYIRDMQGVTSLVLGAETPEQVKENVILMDNPQLKIRL